MANQSGAPTAWKPTDDPLSYFDFLSDELFPPGETLDASTVEAATACSMPHLGPDTTTSASRKRSREDAEEASDYETKEETAAVNDDADDEGSTDKKSAKLAASEAAKNKACREKARRERINGSFNELAKLVDPGKEPKTDKSSILSDGIKLIQQLRVENNQLQQLNKFLEERVAQYERGRGQQLFQLASMQQQPTAAMAPPLQQGTASLPTQVVTGVPCGPSTSSAAAMSGALATFCMPVAQPAGCTSEPGTSAHAAAAAAAAHMFMGKPMNMSAHQPPPYWLPAGMLDSSQDSLLRPPAA